MLCFIVLTIFYSFGGFTEWKNREASLDVKTEASLDVETESLLDGETARLHWM